MPGCSYRRVDAADDVNVSCGEEQVEGRQRNWTGRVNCSVCERDQRAFTSATTSSLMSM